MKDLHQIHSQQLTISISLLVPFLLSFSHQQFLLFYLLFF